MANNPIEQATQGLQRKEGLHDTGRANYQAANIEAPRAKPQPDWAGFIKSATNLYGGYKAETEDRSKRRAEQIISELTTDERREAIANGKLLYQDDAKAMKHLRSLVGQQQAQSLDISLQRRVRNGELKTRAEIDDQFTAKYSEEIPKIAESLGVSPTDPDLLAGFHNNAATRRVAMYETVDQVESGRLEAEAVIAVRNQIGQIIKDPMVFRDPERNVPAVLSVIRNHYANGTIPKASVLRETIGDMMSQLSENAGSTEFVKQMGDQEINMSGEMYAIKDILGQSRFDTLVLNADTNTLAKNNAATEEYVSQLNNIKLLGLSGKHEEAYRALNAVSDALAIAQPSDQTTAAKQQLIASRLQLDDMVQKASMGNATKIANEAQDQEVANEMERGLQAILNGNNVTATIDAKLITGSRAKEADILFANRKQQAVENAVANGLITEEEGIRELMAITALMPEDSVMRERLKGNMTRAQQELNSMVLRDDTEISPESFKTLAAMQTYWKANKAEFGMMNPELAGQLAVIEMLNTTSTDGVGVLVNSMRVDKDMEPSARQIMRDQYDKTLKSSTFIKLGQGSKNLTDSAYILYKAQINQRFNPKDAAATVHSFLKENTVHIQRSDTSIEGVLSKQFLMVDRSDADSYKEGERIVGNYSKVVREAHPELSGDGWSVYQGANDVLVWQHVLSDEIYNKPMADIRREYSVEQQLKAQEAKAKGADKVMQSIADQEKQIAEFANQQKLPQSLEDVRTEMVKDVDSTYVEEPKRTRTKFSFTDWRDGNNQPLFKMKPKGKRK